MARSTESERAARDRLVGRMADQARREGREPNIRQLERKATEIAERSHAQRRDGRPKDGTR